MKNHNEGASRNAQPSVNPALLTDHLALAAFLSSKGYEPKLTEAQNGRVLFGFTYMPGLDADVNAFSDGTASVDPFAYDAARIALRRGMTALMGGGR